MSINLKDYYIPVRGNMRRNKKQGSQSDQDPNSKRKGSKLGESTSLSKNSSVSEKKIPAEAVRGLGPKSSSVTYEDPKLTQEIEEKHQKVDFDTPEAFEWELLV